ncbi:MAG: hypothetical protein GKS06_00785 [Acidobacteria bacterium]|nr:hypothetical protein [Acidobacteriota bacterium]
MTRPPRLAARLLEFVVPSPYGADLLAELDDAYLARAAGGRLAQMRATAWYWRQVVSGNTFRLRAAATELRNAPLRSGATDPGPTKLPSGSDDVRFAVRSLLSAPRYSVAAILALALGIGAVTSIYSTVGGMIRNPLPFEDLETLLAVGEDKSRFTIQEDAEAWLHYADYSYVEELPAFSGIAGLRLRFATLTSPGEPLDVVVYEATANYFDFSGLVALHGRLPSTSQMRDGSVAVLSHEFWQRRFAGRPDVVGEELHMADTEAVVVGVLPPGATYPAGTDLYLPLRLAPELSASFDRGRLTALARLAPDVSLTQARAALTATSDRIAAVAPDSHAQHRLAAMPVRELATFGSSRLIAFLDGGGDLPAAARLRQRCEPAVGAHHSARQRDRRSGGPRVEQTATDPPAPRREPVPVARGRTVGQRAGGLGQRTSATTTRTPLDPVLLLRRRRNRG